MGKNNRITLALSGYYGFDNSGDEAVLQSILLALEEQGRAHDLQFDPVVLSIDPAKTSRAYGVRAVHRMKPGAVFGALREADGLISGGGSLLQDETSSKTIPYYLAVLKLAQWLGKPTFVYSQGIGPVHRKMFYPWIRGTFRKCKYISVRDAESAELLRETGLSGDSIHVVPDPVMGLKLRDGAEPPARADAGSAGTRLPVIGVSVRFWNPDRTELDALAEALTHMLDSQPMELRFLPFHLPSDEVASRHVIQRMGDKYKQQITVIPDAFHPQDMLAEVSRCDLLIGMRLHSLIYAAGQYVPMIGISYDPKIDQFLNRLQMQAAASTKLLHPGTFARHALDLLEARQQWRQEKKEAIERLKAEAGEPARRIAFFFKTSG
ncbi:polysaccharide pyruvyl transferase CsaB [Paenibacillus hamazuiensis]|uniref:polysaccharide pyruvyl transferase CsaB n=1 Tax=Paenibacillus hamazuiensis TaxID=2936508 RepID=UPI00200FE463|nr:polysaccharide pyruvyl transferase CsaB [Paenibacillus hamazuiensis]